MTAQRLPTKLDFYTDPSRQAAGVQGLIYRMRTAI